MGFPAVFPGGAGKAEDVRIGVSRKISSVRRRSNLK
jgi:hypothetical protein